MNFNYNFVRDVIWVPINRTRCYFRCFFARSLLKFGILITFFTKCITFHSVERMFTSPCEKYSHFLTQLLVKTAITEPLLLSTCSLCSKFDREVSLLLKLFTVEVYSGFLFNNKIQFEILICFSL